jgi:hypothetical protein
MKTMVEMTIEEIRRICLLEQAFAIDEMAEWLKAVNGGDHNRMRTDACSRMINSIITDELHCWRDSFDCNGDSKGSDACDALLERIGYRCYTKLETALMKAMADQISQKPKGWDFITGGKEDKC